MPATTPHLAARTGQAATTVGVSWPATVVAGLAATSAVVGLLVDGVYGSDAATAAMLRGYDAVTLSVAAPGLALAARAARHGSVRGRLVTASLLAYLAYTYAYFLLGAGLTDLLLLHAAVFTGSLVGLVLTVATTDPPTLDAHLPSPAAARAVAAVLAVLAGGLGAMWVYACLAYAVAGTRPAGSALVETGTVVHLGIVVDLTLLVPLYAAAAVLLWRRTGLGYLLAALALVAGTLHQVSYVVALLFQYAADVPGAVALDPLEPVILLLYGGATLLLLRDHHPPSGSANAE